MKRLRNTDPHSKTVPGHGTAKPGQQLPHELPEQVARHLLKSGGWEEVDPAPPVTPARPGDDEEE